MIEPNWKKEMEKAGFDTITALSDESGVARPVIYNLLRGTGNICRSSYDRIAAALGKQVKIVLVPIEESQCKK
jgi:hypothetical protein